MVALVGLLVSDWEGFCDDRLIRQFIGGKEDRLIFHLFLFGPEWWLVQMSINMNLFAQYFYSSVHVFLLSFWLWLYLHTCFFAGSLAPLFEQEFVREPYSLCWLQWDLRNSQMMKCWLCRSVQLCGLWNHDSAVRLSRRPDWNSLMYWARQSAVTQVFPAVFPQCAVLFMDMVPFGLQVI